MASPQHRLSFAPGEKMLFDHCYTRATRERLSIRNGGGGRTDMPRDLSRILRHPDLLSGLAFVVLGLAIAWMSQRYAMGTLRRMGPGFLPTALGLIIAGFGAIITLGAGRRPAELPVPVSVQALRPVVLILGAITFWAAAIEVIGLVLSTFGLVLIAAAASPGFRLLPALATAAVATVFAWAVFILGLNMPIPVLWRSG